MAARSAATALARSAAALAAAIESARRRSSALLSGAGAGAGVATGAGSGAGCSGLGFPPQAAANPAVARTNNRVGARIRTPRSGLGGDRGPTQAAGPRREPRGARRLELAHAAGLDVDDPELASPAPVRDEGDVTAIGRPRRVLVAARRRELADPPARHVDEKQLRAARHLAMEHDIGPVGGPLRGIGAAGGAVVERREQFLIGAVGGHDVDLGRPGSRRHERETTAIW